MKPSHPHHLHCIRCQGPLERKIAQWGDPILWCAACERGWLPGTKGFDNLLERQGEGPDPQPDLWHWLESQDSDPKFRLSSS